ncbi:MAG: Glyceraldehyde-3-phosphate dehydrogenase [Microgenomates bacterium OLB22]|nr:MAG: Glyceraldehyde-3-phosphate dehydrogenase [Microgenomates bacterium OLB22]
MTSQKADPADIPWDTTDTDVVLDCTGAFRVRKDLEKHLSQRVKFVLLSGPTQDKTIPHLVLGVNDTVLTERNPSIISNASCTTNCVSLLLKTIHAHLGIDKGFISTTHAYTSTQTLLDNDSGDFNRSRAAALSIVPTDTGAASAVIRVMPELENKVEGIALRIPTPTGSFADVACIVQKRTTVEEINAIFRRQSTALKNYLGYSEAPLVSADYVGSPYSCIYDANYTKIIGGTFIKVCGWYDNEWGYANRLVDALSLYSSHH